MQFFSKTQDYSRVLRGAFLFLNLAVAIFATYQLGDYLTPQVLKQLKDSVDSFISNSPVRSRAGFVALMTFIVGFNVPGATFMALCSGVFFSQPFATVAAFSGYTIGALINYTAWRLVFGDAVRGYLAKASGQFRRFEDGLKKAENFWETVAFLIFIRYVAFFPFWLVNAACAALSVKFGTFLFTTAFSTVPGAILYSMMGRVFVESALYTVTTETDTSTLLRSLLWRLLFEDESARGVAAMLLFCISFPALLQLPKFLARPTGMTSDGTRPSTAKNRSKSRNNNNRDKSTTSITKRPKIQMNTQQTTGNAEDHEKEDKERLQSSASSRTRRGKSGKLRNRNASVKPSSANKRQRKVQQNQT
ncbi:unnamed protein product [Amoebophrya sp. A25]|nr:unnamed protein product [Amoebophrya sp. A25]|eukprot:GSA25T00000164001.1